MSNNDVQIPENAKTFVVGSIDRNQFGSNSDKFESYYGISLDAAEVGQKLYSATELAIQSILLLHHNPLFSLNQTHTDTRVLFSEHAELGNIDTKFSGHYTKLEELRDKGRYLNGTHGRTFSLDEVEADNVLKITKDLIDYVDELLEKVDLSKKPTIGEYCLLGRS